MARKTRARANSNSSNSIYKSKKLNVPSSSQAKKTRKMDEILGVQALDFASSDEDEVMNLGQHLSPKSSLMHLQQQSEVRHQFLEWMTAN